MAEKYFLDTNFLINLFSTDKPQKRLKCQNILTLSNSNFDISSQVLKEFSAVMIGKFKAPPLEVKSIISKLSEYEIITVQIEMIKDAIDLHILNRFSFWDSLIICAALSSKCDFLVTEDLQNHQDFNGLLILNPFLLRLGLLVFMTNFVCIF